MNTSEHQYPQGLQRTAIVATVMLCALMAVIDTSIVNVALPTIGASLGASVGDTSWIAIAYMLANIAVMPLNGFLTQLFGQKRFFLIAVGGFTIASFLCGLAPNIETLIIARVLQGLFGGALMPISQTILFQTYPKSEHGKAMGMFGLGVIAGPAIGPTLGGWMTDTWGWPSIFNINLPLGVLAVFMAMRTFADTPRPAFSGKRFDWAGLISLVSGLSAMQYVLERGEEEGWTDSRLIVFLAVYGVVSLIFFVWHELRTDNPVVDLSVLRDRSFTAGSLIGVITGFGLYGMNIVLPLFFAGILRYDAVHTGMALMPGALATAFSMPFAGRIADRFDPRVLISIGIGLFLYFLWDLSGINPATGYWDVFWPQVIRGVGLGLLFVPLSAVTMSGISREKQAAASGLNNLLRQLGGSVGIAILTSLLTRSQRIHYGYLIEHVTIYDREASQRLALLKGAMQHLGSSATVAQQKALVMLNGTVRMQAAILAYIDLFQLTAVIFLFCLIPLVFLKRAPSKVSAPVDVH
jgi:DHA2 family multidrug resistance protein